eukprot:1721038-Pleurochrysis_carterae.AAC.3
MLRGVWTISHPLLLNLPHCNVGVSRVLTALERYERLQGRHEFREHEEEVPFWAVAPRALCRDVINDEEWTDFRAAMSGQY